MPGQRIEREVIAYQRGEPVNRSAQVGGIRGQIDADGRGDRQHGDRKAVITVRIRSDWRCVSVLANTVFRRLRAVSTAMFTASAASATRRRGVRREPIQQVSIRTPDE